uniref:Uncharacterized protein n=1 Tax=Anguilla anguilla TaxID=7936 RepID=A0A0E9QV20_ANGAN
MVWNQHNQLINIYPKLINLYHTTSTSTAI